MAVIAKNLVPAICIACCISCCILSVLKLITPLTDTLNEVKDCSFLNPMDWGRGCIFFKPAKWSVDSIIYKLPIFKEMGKITKWLRDNRGTIYWCTCCILLCCGLALNPLKGGKMGKGQSRSHSGRRSATTQDTMMQDFDQGGFDNYGDQGRFNDYGGRQEPMFQRQPSQFMNNMRSSMSSARGRASAGWGKATGRMKGMKFGRRR